MITSETMTLEEMQKRVKRGYVCQKCNSSLSVAWGGYFGVNSHILRCSKDANHNGITRPFEVSNYDQPGYNMPGTINA